MKKNTVEQYKVCCALSLFIQFVDVSQLINISSPKLQIAPLKS